MCIAKAITSGYFPLGACVVNDKLEAAFKANKDALGAIYHGYTYSGHPVGCAAALAAIEETVRLDVVSNAAEQGRRMLDGFNTLMARHAAIGDVRGKGLMLGIEIVADRATKAPAGKKYMGKLADLAYDAGALIRTSGNIIILSPPLILSHGDAEGIVAAVDVAFRDNAVAPKE
jgi:adenosylmethionine-8-amino-7-oxononanoate aminotransferase